MCTYQFHIFFRLGAPFDKDSKKDPKMGWMRSLPLWMVPKKFMILACLEKFFESLEDIENNYLEINDVFNPFDVFKEINFESNEIDFPELEDIQIIKELTLSESLEKSSSISSLLNNKIISLGEEPKEKIYTLNCQSLEQIIDDLKDFKASVSELEEELEKSFLVTEPVAPRTLSTR